MTLSYTNMTTEEELYKYKEAFKKAGSPKTIDRLTWFHFKNIARSPLVTLVTDNGHLAAIYATLPIKVKLGEKVVNACQSLDTLTDEDYRGKGLFISAATKRYQENAKKGYDFVYGFPNSNSVHGFVKKLDWSLLGGVPFLFRPLRTGYFLKKLMGRRLASLIDMPLAFPVKVKLDDDWSIKPVSKFDVSFDELWDSFSHDIPVAVQRDSNYLNWRYIENPTTNYEVFALYRNEVVQGFVVYTSVNKHGGKVGYIMELIVRPKAKKQSKVLLLHAQNYFLCNKVDVILAWCFAHSANYSLYAGSRYWPIPDRLRPIELHFGYVSLNKENVLLTKRENWYISYSDSDTV